MPRIIPDNAAKGLEDVIALCAKQRREWRDAMERAIKIDDLILQARLGRMRDTLAEIERKVRDARNNRYEDEIREVTGTR